MQPPYVERGSHHLNAPVQWERRGSLPCSLIPRNYFLDFLKHITHLFCAYPRQWMVSAHSQHAISRAPSKYGGCINFDRHCMSNWKVSVLSSLICYSYSTYTCYVRLITLSAFPEGNLSLRFLASETWLIGRRETCNPYHFWVISVWKKGCVRCSVCM